MDGIHVLPIINYSYKPLSDLNFARYTGQYGSCVPSLAASPFIKGGRVWYHAYTQVVSGLSCYAAHAKPHS